MQSFRQVGAGILLGIISVVMVLGGLVLSLAEGGAGTDFTSTDFPTQNTPGEVITSFPTLSLITFTDTPQGSDFTATASITPPPTLTNCPPPTGWLPILTQSQDTLESLAQTYNSSVNLLRVNNCLLSDQLIANSVLYVPPQPTVTSVPCGAPLGWVNYTVVSGDTLYHISLLYRITVSILRQANCLSSDVIRAGQTLKVPNVPTSTAPAFSTNTPTTTLTPTISVTTGLTGTPSLTLTLTQSQSVPSVTGTVTKTPPTATQTSDLTGTPSLTTAPSQTPVPSATVTPSPSS